MSVKRKSWKETAPPDLFIIYNYTSVVLTVELPDCMTHLYTCGGNSELIQGQHVISVLWLLLIDLQLACYVVSFIVSDNDLIVKFLFQAFHGIDFYTFEMMPLHFTLYADEFPANMFVSSRCRFELQSHLFALLLTARHRSSRVD